MTRSVRRWPAVLAAGAVTLGLALGPGGPALATGPALAAATVPGTGCADPLLPRDLPGPAALATGGSALVGEVVEDGRVAGSGAGGDATASEVRDLLTTEAGLTVDRCGDLYYVERGATTAEVAALRGTADPRTTAAARTTAGTVTADPGADVLALHSRPGSDRVIHLDTDGADLTGTQWALRSGLPSLTAGPFDTDGDPAVLSPRERDAIRTVWQVVAEDFAPFDVDVTTEDPGDAAVSRTSTADPTFGTRAVITSSLPAVEEQCFCGGIAYVGVFDDVGDARHAMYQPALVFPESLGRSAKAIGEATSHEVGHNLGLYHDGAGRDSYYEGHGVWAPIMGVGYRRPVTQWSRGEYSGADNPEQDLAVMAAHGLTPLPDDHGDQPASGTALAVAGGSGTAGGTITSAGDVDWFRVQHAAGPVSVTVTPQGSPADLDVRLLVQSGDGAGLADADPAETAVDARLATGLAASWSGVRPAGTTLVGVRGGGSGTPSTGWSAYGSLGGYRVVVAASPPVASAPLAVRTTALAPGTVGRPWSAGLASTGGLAPVEWTATGLPGWARLTPEGRLGGVPTGPLAARPVLVTATDRDGRTATAQLSLSVAQPVRITGRAVARAAVGRPVRLTYSATGGRGALAWSSSRLPAGWRFSDGVLVARLARAGSAGVTLSARDADGRTASLRVDVSAGG